MEIRKSLMVNPLNMRLGFAFFRRSGQPRPKWGVFKSSLTEGGSRSVQVDGDSFELIEPESRKYLGQDFYRAINRSTWSELEDD